MPADKLPLRAGLSDKNPSQMRDHGSGRGALRPECEKSGLAPGFPYSNRCAWASIPIATTTAALITGPAAIVAPERIAQIQIARIGGGANNTARYRTGSSAEAGISGRRTKGSAARRADQRTAGSAVTRISAAAGDQQGRRKTQYQSRTHNLAPCSVQKRTVLCANGSVRNRVSVNHIKKHSVVPVLDRCDAHEALRHWGEKTANTAGTDTVAQWQA